MKYYEIVEYGNWLEDAKHGRYSRYAIGDEESAWVDHDNETVVSGPDEDEYDEIEE